VTHLSHVVAQAHVPYIALWAHFTLQLQAVAPPSLASSSFSSFHHRLPGTEIVLCGYCSPNPPYTRHTNVVLHGTLSSRLSAAPPAHLAASIHPLAKSTAPSSTSCPSKCPILGPMAAVMPQEIPMMLPCKMAEPLSYSATSTGSAPHQDVLDKGVHPFHQPAMPSHADIKTSPHYPVVVTPNPMVKQQVRSQRGHGWPQRPSTLSRRPYT
jgi:hypothetical protein